MELIKNPEALQAALSKPGLDQQTFYLDPVTSNDGYSRSLILLGIFLLFPASLIAFNFFPDDTWPLICLGLLVGGCFYALHSFNEFWEVDLVARELRLRESFLGFLRTRKTIPFGRLLSLAVSGHQHCSNKSNRIRRWWEYGIAVLEADGTSHRLFPNLSRSYKTVRDLAELLAETLEVSFFTPRPLGELEVVEEDGQQRYRYATSAEALLKVDSTPAEVPEESTEPAWKESPGQAEALEFVEEQEAAGQAGCAILGLVVVSPFALTGVRWLCQGVLDGDP